MITTLGKVAGGLKVIINLPKTIIRLGNLMLQVADDDFLREAARLGNERMQAE